MQHKRLQGLCTKTVNDAVNNTVAKGDGSGWDNWNYKRCKAPFSVTITKPTFSFLQAACLPVA